MYLGMKPVLVNVDWMQMFIIIKNVGIMINANVNAKKMIDKGICDDRLICNTSICECKCDTLCDVGKYLCYENCKCRNKLIDKLVLEWEDEILNAIPLKAINTISVTEKNNCLIYIMLLIIMCLILLAIISVSCYYYHTRYWLKKGKSMPIYKWVV